MPAFIIIGSRIMPAISPWCAASTRSSAVEVVERHDPHQIGHLLRDARARHAVGVVDRTELVGRSEDRDHRRVVVTVVGALDLDHQRAAR